VPLFDYECKEGHRLNDRLTKADLSDAPSTCPLVIDGPSPIDGAPVSKLCGLPIRRAFPKPGGFPKAGAWRAK